MSRTTYRLFDGTTRVSTAVKLKDGSILMVYPRMENYADVDLWKWVIEHEAEYVDLPLTLSTHDMNLPSSPPTMIPLIPQLSPYTPPLAPIKINPLILGHPMSVATTELGPTAEGICDDITLTPQISPRAEFQEPLPSTPPPLWQSTSEARRNLLKYAAPPALAPSASFAPYNPCMLGPSMEGPGYDSDDDVHRNWLMKYELTNIQSDLAALARTMNERFNLMDVRIKALIKKLD